MGQCCQKCIDELCPGTPQEVMYQEYSQLHDEALKHSVTTVNRDVWSVYRKGEELGKGAVGSVRVATDRYTTAARSASLTVPLCSAGRRFACKSMLTERVDDWRELAIMAKCQHPHLVRMYSAFCWDGERDTDGRQMVHIIMQLFPHGNLGQYIKRHGAMPEECCLRLIRQVCSALECLQKIMVNSTASLAPA